MTAKKEIHKCPFCDKTFSKQWRVINHIRQCRGRGHGPMGDLPEGFNPNTYTYDKQGVKAATDPLHTNTQPQTQPEPQPQTKEGSTDFKVEVINPPIKSTTEILLCPDCNTPKTEWLNINQVDEATADEKRAYDYMCPNCGELIKINE